MEEFINYVYDKTISYVIKDFSLKELEEVEKSYREYLEFQYSDVVNETNIEKSKEVFTKVEIENFKNAPKIKKQIILLKDLALDEVKYFSDYARVYADERRCNDRIIITSDQARSYIKQMEQLVKQVRDFNLEIANKLLSESIVDFLYASGISDNMSLRSARYKK